MLGLYVRAQNAWYRLRSQRGQGMVEYGLIIALVAIFLVTALVALRGNLDKVFKNISDTLSNNSSPPPASSQ